MMALKQNWQLAPVTVTLTGLMVVVFGLEIILSGGFTISQSALLTLGAQDAPDILLRQQWWRLLTAGFLHASGMHLLLNGLVFYYLGRLLEQALGHWQVASLFFFSMVMGNVAELAFLTQLNTIGLGASGGVFGLIAAMIYLGWVEKRPGFWKAQAKTMLLFVGLNIVFGLFSPGISHWAHSLGFLAGLVITPALLQSAYAQQTFKHSRVTSYLALALSALLGLALALWIYYRFGGN